MEWCAGRDGRGERSSWDRSHRLCWLLKGAGMYSQSDRELWGGFKHDLICFYAVGLFCSVFQTHHTVCGVLDP